MAVNDLQFNPGWLSMPWAEHISRSGGTQDGRFGYDGGNSATYSLQVAYDDRNQAMAELCGTNRYDPAKLRLERVPPLPHPEFPHLLCTGISSCRGLKFLGKRLVNGRATSYYARALITATFAMPPWLVTMDNPAMLRSFGELQEWRRFVRMESTSSNESFVLEPDSFKWAEGQVRAYAPLPAVGAEALRNPDSDPVAPAGAANGPRIGARVTASLSQTLYKRDIVLTWYRVPAYGLLSSLTGREENLIAGANCVNQFPFLGCEAGTLLMKGHKLIAKECPTFEAAELARRGITPIMYDVVINLTHFDPPPGGVARGHRLSPWRYNGKWYLIQHSSSVPARYLLEEYDFARLFTLPG